MGTVQSTAWKYLLGAGITRCGFATTAGEPPPATRADGSDAHKISAVRHIIQRFLEFFSKSKFSFIFLCIFLYLLFSFNFDNFLNHLFSAKIIYRQ